MNLLYSFIIPVYNRPFEVEELLESLVKQKGAIPFEVVLVEDGSTETSAKVVKKYTNDLAIKYFVTENQGAGKSRNYGMEKASANYFIILDSDCILPENYLQEVDKALKLKFTDAFGGPDAAHKNFTDIQKAINYSMTSFFTTGGIRGKKKGVGKFQPRSFNFGISKKAFENTAGFSDLKIGEDIDLTFRLWEAGFETQLLEKAFVYHKRRATFQQFYEQTKSFGSARPLLNKRYPGSAKITYWFPSVFYVSFLFALSLYMATEVFFFIELFYLYFFLVFVHSSILNKSIKVGVLSVLSTAIQFYGYGTGFLRSYFSTKIKP
ncbi:glycosyltransferase [Flavicella sediminum]|uniref:glycosyltransferase n=1 Tax=Flavicella sediminum TaxID=2585141 RepID=UPI001AA04CA3|nr:glycosyltransferase [Flavicella sediminum]